MISHQINKRTTVARRSIVVISGVALAIALAFSVATEARIYDNDKECRDNGGTPATDSSTGEKWCRGPRNNDHGPIISARNPGAGSAGAVRQAGSTDARIGPDPPPDIDLRTKTDLESQVRTIQARANNATSVQSLPGPMCSKLMACCQKYGGSCCDGLNYCR